MTTSISEATKDQIRAQARSLGFDLCQFADVTAPWPASARLAAFVEAGHHGEMDWMAETLDRRSHPTAMWGEARAAIVLGMNYGPATDPRTVLDHPDQGAISVYAQGDDYHDLIKGRLKQLASWVVGRFGGELKVFVDTAPLMEKPLAERAGLGWQGKHTNLVSRELGSWLFLGSILTVLEIEPDPPEVDHCGSCRACLDACPTNAFPAPYQLDARRCISYLTIELKVPVPTDLRPALGNRIYGCDDCLAACPWNKFAQAASEIRLQARATLRAPSLIELAGLDDAAFRALFSKSPVKRIGRSRFLRNVLYALGNAGDPLKVEAIRPHLEDPSGLVRGAAVWALSRYLAPSEMLALRTEDPDPEVAAEWDQACQSGAMPGAS